MFSFCGFDFEIERPPAWMRGAKPVVRLIGETRKKGTISMPSFKEALRIIGGIQERPEDRAAARFVREWRPSHTKFHAFVR